MKRKLFIVAALLIGLLITGSQLMNAAESIYGHISYVEANPKVIRVDKSQEDGVVNLPLAPGDQVVTNGKSRCEIQFDNGTVMRLDKNSHLKIVTVLAPSLTSKWKLTTIQLMKGNLYSLNQSYNLERFQVLTPNAAINMKRNAVSTICLRDKGETHIFTDRGKVKVLYGDHPKALKTESIRSGNGFLVTTEHKCVSDMSRDVDFLAWNQYIDRNFKKLHYGINKLPQKIYKYGPGIVRWAEKWSNMFGEWVYDEVFGYVWKPGDFRFAFSARPFFHGKFIHINNQLFVVPTEAWGWVPSQMGTWVWLKSGWTWVPGNAYNNCQATALFPNAAEFSQPYYSNIFNQWLNYSYGGLDLYYVYHRDGLSAWRRAYYRTHGREIHTPPVKDIPENIRQLIKKINKSSLAQVKERLAKITPTMKREVAAKFTAPRNRVRKFDGIKQTLASSQEKKDVYEGQVIKRPKANVMKSVNSDVLAARKGKISTAAALRYHRDWNPDKKWAKKNGVKVHYSSKTNEVVCPRLKLNSSRLSGADKYTLRVNRVSGLAINAKSGRPYSSNSGNVSSSRSRGASYTGGHSSSSSRAGSSRSTSHSGSKGGGSSSKSSK